MYTHTQKSIENKKITFLENVKKIKNILIKAGGTLKIEKLSIIAIKSEYTNYRGRTYYWFSIDKSFVFSISKFKLEESYYMKYSFSSYTNSIISSFFLLHSDSISLPEIFMEFN